MKPTFYLSVLIYLGLTLCASGNETGGSLTIAIDGENVKVDAKGISLSIQGLSLLEKFLEQKAAHENGDQRTWEIKIEGKDLPQVLAEINSLTDQDPQVDRKLKKVWKDIRNANSADDGRTKNLGEQVFVGKTFRIERNERVSELVAVGANGTIEGEVGELFAVGSEIILTDSAKVSEEMVTVGSRMNISPHAQVTSAETNVLFPMDGRFRDAIAKGTSFWNWSWGWTPKLLSWLLVFALGFLYLRAAPHFYRRATDYVHQEPFSSLGMGFAGLMVAFFGVIALIISLVGIALLPLYFLCLFVIYLLGSINIGHAIAERIFLGRPLKDWQAMGLGLLIVRVMGLIPFLGWFFNIAVALIGMGAIVHTFWTRRHKPVLT